ncbi:MAG TPA: sigma-70 family RNA polymerase sigma factor [Chitinophagaceae bacterium]|nr:sigma-70 family RNA polymerase sigma factor [Chitinophagaceae bacterium]
MEVIRKLSDAELVAAIRRGSGLDAAIKFIYGEHFEGLTRIVKNNSGNQQDAEDIFQEVLVNFIGLVQHDKFRGESSVKTFLFSMTKHTWLNELKKRGRTEVRELKYEKERDQQEMDVSHIIAENEAKKQVMNVVAHLDDTCKKILVMFYFENLSMKEILTSLKYENEQVVRNKKYKCLKQLEQMIASNPSLYQNLKNMLHG